MDTFTDFFLNGYFFCNLLWFTIIIGQSAKPVTAVTLMDLTHTWGYYQNNQLVKLLPVLPLIKGHTACSANELWQPLLTNSLCNHQNDANAH